MSEDNKSEETIRRGMANELFYCFLTDHGPEELNPEKDPDRHHLEHTAIFQLSRVLAESIVRAEYIEAESTDGVLEGEVPRKYLKYASRLEYPPAHFQSVSLAIMELAVYDEQINLETSTFATVLEIGVGNYIYAIKALPWYFNDPSEFVDEVDLKNRYPLMRRAFFDQRHAENVKWRLQSRDIYYREASEIRAKDENWPDIIDD